MKRSIRGERERAFVGASRELTSGVLQETNQPRMLIATPSIRTHAYITFSLKCGQRHSLEPFPYFIRSYFRDTRQYNGLIRASIIRMQPPVSQSVPAYDG